MKSTLTDGALVAPVASFIAAILQDKARFSGDAAENPPRSRAVSPTLSATSKTHYNRTTSVKPEGRNPPTLNIRQISAPGREWRNPSAGA
jgi:hypothetical protein